MLGGLEKVGWGIMNEGTEGEFSYTGERGQSMIDYVIGDIKIREFGKDGGVGECGVDPPPADTNNNVKHTCRNNVFILFIRIVNRDLL